jgi:ribosomal protein S18 acetylase RimI-like enzyme
VPDDIAIMSAAAARLPVLADVVGRAFLDDPMIRWPMAEAPDMHARVARFFSVIYGPLIDDGNILEAGDGAGFAHWVPPGSASDALDTTDELMAALTSLTDDGGARYDVLWAWIEERVPDDVWYLDMVAVDPAEQGKGIGSALVRFGLERAATEGADSFLETSVPDNVAYYERFGFRVVEAGEPVEGCPRIWFMRSGA